jgi:hypothetical protein
MWTTAYKEFKDQVRCDEGILRYCPHTHACKSGNGDTEQCRKEAAIIKAKEARDARLLAENEIEYRNRMGDLLGER